LAIDEGEFAGGESGTYGASDGVEHGEILTRSAVASEPLRRIER
jgi:hypothetical protein